jgi:hypothetical protein
MARFWSVRYRGHSLMVKLQPSKLAMRVRFSLPAPICSASRLYADKTGVLNNSFRTSSRSSLVWPHKFTVLARLNRIPCCQRFLTVKRLAASSQSHSSAFSQPQNLPAQHEGYSQKPLHEAPGHHTKHLLENIENGCATATHRDRGLLRLGQLRPGHGDVKACEPRGF